MVLKRLLIILTILFTYVYLDDEEDESIFCSKDFCTAFIKKEKCRALPNACDIQNETHNGIFLPSPAPCNCCKYCLENLGQNETCSVGESSSAAPKDICGGGLSCQESSLTCQEMNTDCVKAQLKYDKDRRNGCLGHLQVRPECEDDGTYKPYMIIPGEIVYCVSENGDRIFGEVPEANFNRSEFNCQCSRNYNRTKEHLHKDIHQVEHFRCKSNGDYDALQCIGSYCLCANEIDGAPANDSAALVKIDKISNTTLECFDNEAHVEFEYYRECESKYRKEFDVIKEHILNDFEILEMKLPNCQLDGYYAPIQENDTAKFCVDPHGAILENFELNKDENPILAKNMDCKCARARSIIVDDEKPECCPNGNYRELQCRRGMCHCVDSNGHQIIQEVEFDKKETLCCGDESLLCGEKPLCKRKPSCDLSFKPI